MFWPNLERVDLNTLSQCVPQLEDKKLVYYRRESTENITFYIANGKTQELSMNGEAWEILKLCNGKRSVGEICRIFSSRYNHIDPSINLARDVADILFMFDKLGALSWNEGGSPFMINEISHDENGLMKATYAKSSGHIKLRFVRQDMLIFLSRQIIS